MKRILNTLLVLGRKGFSCLRFCGCSPLWQAGIELDPDLCRVTEGCSLSSPWVTHKQKRQHAGTQVSVSSLSLFIPQLCPVVTAHALRAGLVSSAHPLWTSPHKHNRRYSSLMSWEFLSELTITSSPFDNPKLKHITLIHNILCLAPRPCV